MKKLIESLKALAVKNLSAHQHHFPFEEMTQVIIRGNGNMVEYRPMRTSYCTECSAITLNGEVFVKNAEPNMYVKE